MAKFKTEQRYFTADGVQVSMCGSKRENGRMLYFGFAADDLEHTTPLTITRGINYKIDAPSLHKCNAKCQSATGPSCECECGGKNHGRGGN